MLLELTPICLVRYYDSVCLLNFSALYAYTAGPLKKRKVTIDLTDDVDDAAGAPGRFYDPVTLFIFSVLYVYALGLSKK